LFRGGVDIEILIRTPLIYGISYFNWGLDVLFGGTKPTKAPVATGLNE